METLTLTPAYNRDYQTVEQVLDHWKQAKDFTIQDVSCPFNGKYINSQDADNFKELKNTTFRIRFNKLADIVFIKKQDGVWIITGGPRLPFRSKDNNPDDQIPF